MIKIIKIKRKGQAQNQPQTQPRPACNNKIWRMTVAQDATAFLYISSEDEAYYFQSFLGSEMYTAEKAAPKWKPGMVCNLNGLDINRLTFIDQEFWVCSENAMRVLSPLLGEMAEFLPLIPRTDIGSKIPVRHRSAYKPLIDMVPDETHYLLNILDIKTLEVINAQASDFEFDEDNQRIFMTETLAFYPDKIKDALLFKIMKHGRALKMTTFISERFREIVEDHKLTGLFFFPAPEDDGGNLVWEDLQPAGNCD